MSKLIVNVETGETTERELNKAEKDQQKIDEAANAQLEAESEAKATAKAALLIKLGITAEEARLLFS
jgi:F0F1-type ATP synthase membrane subunit b/b'